MALSNLRKPLALAEAGYQQELNSSSNLQVGGLSASTLEISGNVDAANLLISGQSTLTGNVAALANLSVTSAITAASASLSGALEAATGNFSGNVSTGNLSTNLVSGSSAAFSGSLQAASGNFTGNVSSGNLSTNLISGSSAALSGALTAATGNFTGNVSTGNLSTNIISGSSATLSGNITAAGGLFSGNVSAANLEASGLLRVTGGALVGSLTSTGAVSGTTGTFTGLLQGANISTAGQLTVNGQASVGSLTTLGNVTAGNVSASSGTVSARFVTASANVTAGNVVSSGLISGATASFTGNVSTGNLSTGVILGTSATLSSSLSAASAGITGALTAATGTFTGNVSAGNVSATLVEATTVSATGNVSASNLVASSLVSGATASFTGNVSASNLVASSLVSGATASFTGNVSVGNISSNVVSGTVGSFSTNVTVNGVLIGDSGRISNLTDPVAAQDAATKYYVDGIAAGLDIKPSVKTISTSSITLSGTQTINGVALNIDDRILVAGQGGDVTTPAIANGIYVVSSSGWSRASDMASGANAAGNFTFVEQGTSYADTGWVCVTDTAIVGTNALRFTQFSSAGVIEAGAGLLKTGNTLDVIVDEGIKIDGSNKVAVNLASSSGLEFSSKALKIALADSSLELSASGLAVKLSGTTLSKTSGLEVLGVPSLFTVAGTATAVHVTAANLNVFSSGSTVAGGDASALHFHNMVETMDFSAHSNGLTKGDPVFVSAGFEAKKATAAVADGDGMVFGVTAANVSGGGTARIICSGIASGVLSGVGGTSPGTKVYLGDSGGLTTNIASISAGKRLILMGMCINSNDLLVQVRDYGQKAS